MAKFKIGSLAKYAAAASTMMLATQGDALAQLQNLTITAQRGMAVTPPCPVPSGDRFTPA